MHEEFYKLWRARPFEPFDIFVKNGVSLSITHPELICTTDREHVVGIGRPDGTILTVHLKWVSRVTRHPRRRGTS